MTSFYNRFNKLKKFIIIYLLSRDSSQLSQWPSKVKGLSNMFPKVSVILVIYVHTRKNRGEKKQSMNLVTKLVSVSHVPAYLFWLQSSDSFLAVFPFSVVLSLSISTPLFFRRRESWNRKFYFVYTFVTRWCIFILHKKKLFPPIFFLFFHAQLLNRNNLFCSLLNKQ